MRTPLFVLAALLLALPAVAQAPEAPEEIRYRKVTAIDFSEVEVKGALVGPKVIWVKERSQRRFRSLIELRSTFAPELIRSAGAL